MFYTSTKSANLCSILWLIKFIKGLRVFRQNTNINRYLESLAKAERESVCVL